MRKCLRFSILAGFMICCSIFAFGQTREITKEDPKSTSVNESNEEYGPREFAKDPAKKVRKEERSSTNNGIEVTTIKKQAQEEREFPDDFPKFIDTGNPEIDNENYAAAKSAWVQANPDKYKQAVNAPVPSAEKIAQEKALKEQNPSGK